MQEVVYNIEKRKKYIIKAGIVFVVIMLLLTFFSKTINNLMLPEVDYKNPTPGFLEKSVDSLGVVKASESLKYYSYGSWKVQDVMVKEGDNVSKDTIIVAFDTKDILADLKKKESEMESAELDIEIMKNSFINSELPTYQYEAEQALNEIKKQEDNVNSIIELFNIGAETDQNLATAKSMLNDAQKDYGLKLKQVQQKKTEYDMVLKQKQLEIDQKKLEFESFKKNLPENGQIKSEYDASIISMNMEKGYTTSNGQVIFELARKGEKILVEWLLSPAKAAEFKEGDFVKLFITDPENITFSSKISSKFFQSKESMYHFTSILQDKKATLLQDGQEIDVKSIKRSSSYPFIVPNSCVMKSGGVDCVFVLKTREGALGEESYVVQVNVSIEGSDDYSTAISGVVDSSSNIVVYTTKALADGMRVKLR